jgi:hypothetical protein
MSYEQERRIDRSERFARLMASRMLDTPQLTVSLNTLLFFKNKMLDPSGCTTQAVSCEDVD